MQSQGETEDQKLKIIRLKINSEVQKFQDASISLSKPVPFQRFPNENKINSQIADIMYDAALILDRTTSKKIDLSKMGDNMPPEAKALFDFDEPIQQMKEQIEELSFDVENQSIQFDEATTTAHQLFSDKIIFLQKEYQARIAKLVIDYTNEEERMEKKLEGLHEKLDSQLEKEFSQQIAERDEIRKQLISLKQKYEETSIMLNSQANLSTAAHKSNSQTSFSLSSPMSAAASNTDIASSETKNHISSINGDDGFPSSMSTDINTIRKKGRSRGMAIEKSMPTITRDRSLNASSDAFNINDNNNDNSDALIDNDNENNRLASSSLYYENTSVEENSASLANQIEEEEEYALSGESYENSNENENFAVSVNSADIDNESEKTDIVYYNKRAEKAKSEKQKLSEELYRLQNYYSREKNRLREDIIKAKNASDMNVKKQLEKQKSNYQRKRKQFDELFKQREKDLKKKIALVEETKVSSANKIRNEIDERKKSIRESDVLIQSKIRNIEKKTNDEIQKYDNEISQLKIQNEAEIQEIKNNHLATMKKLRDGQIQKFPIRPPPQPPSSSPNSPSSTCGGLSESSTKQVIKSPRRTESQLDLNLPSIGSKLKSFKRASNNELAAIDRASQFVEEQYNIEKQIQQFKVDFAKTNFDSIEQKKEIVSMKINYLDVIKNNLSDNQKINVLQKQKHEIDELDKKLLSIKNDKPEKVDFQVIQNEMSTEKTSKLNSLESTKNKMEQIKSELEEKYKSLMQDESNRRQLKSLNSKLLEAEEQLKNAKKYINDSSFKEFHLSDNDSDQKSDDQNKNEIHMPEGSSPSVQRIQMESKCISSLPLLKH